MTILMLNLFWQLLPLYLLMLVGFLLAKKLKVTPSDVAKILVHVFFSFG
jgi:predicted permease